MASNCASPAGATPPLDVATLVRALQFGDSMFPIGSFSFSSALESAIQTRVVADPASLREFTQAALEQAARGDGIALLAAHRAARANDIALLVEIDRRVYARKLSEEARTMTVRMGKKFIEASVKLLEAPLPRVWRDRINASATPGCYPVALAISFAAQQLPAFGAFTVHQYGVASAILGAALRLMKIGHLETQAILYDLNGRIPEAYAAAARASLDDMAGFAPLTDILAAVHAKAHVRLFMS